MNQGRFKRRWLGQSALVIYGMVAFILLAVIWSLWAELDQVSRAPGQVIPTGRIQIIQSTDGGKIEQSLRFILQQRFVSAFVIGFSKTGHIDDIVRRIERVQG